MSGVEKIDTYTTLYNEKLQQAEWYKQPNVRTFIRGAGLVSIAALIVISSISAHALASPLSSVGTIGHNLIGHGGLVAVTATGFTGVVVVYALWVTYNLKSVFLVSEYIDQEKGYFYSIKDPEGQTKGYLAGSIHMLPKNWKGLNPQLRAKVDECEHVYVECYKYDENPFFNVAYQCTNKLENFLYIQKGLDYKLVDYAKEKQKALHQFEGVNDQLKMIAEFRKGISADQQKHKRQQKPQVEGLDRFMVLWKLGSDEIKSELLSDLSGGDVEGMSPEGVKACTAFIHDRNVKWMPAISEALHQEEKPIFIAVGASHLFDFPEINTTGLISLLQEDGWTLERNEM